MPYSNGDPQRDHNFDNHPNESERWLVLQALYGLVQAPRCWYGDGVLRTLTWAQDGKDFRLQQTEADRNLWMGLGSDPAFPDRSPEVAGLVRVYGDDILITAEDSVQAQVIQQVGSKWKSRVHKRVYKGYV